MLKGKVMETFQFGNKKIALFGEGDDIVFIPASAEEGAKIARMTRNCRLAVIDGFDWNLDLSPWKAKAAFRQGGDFGGGAESFLSGVIEIAGRFDGRKFIAGYSLAGLFALWSVTKTDIFYGAASVSGSMWFDGFTGYLAGAKLNAEKIYFSLGDRERNARDPRLASVEDRTREIYENVKSRGIETVFELNPGGHFNEPEKRCAKAIEWLISGGKQNV